MIFWFSGFISIIIITRTKFSVPKQTFNVIYFLSSYPNYPSSLKSVLFGHVEGEIDNYCTIAQNLGNLSCVLATKVEGLTKRYQFVEDA